MRRRRSGGADERKFDLVQHDTEERSTPGSLEAPDDETIDIFEKVRLRPLSFRVTANLRALDLADTGFSLLSLPSPPVESRQFAFSRTRLASSGSRNPPAPELISESVTSIDCPWV